MAMATPAGITTAPRHGRSHETIPRMAIKTPKYWLVWLGVGLALACLAVSCGLAIGWTSPADEPFTAAPDVGQPRGLPR